MKKILAISISLLMLLALISGCNNANKTADGTLDKRLVGTWIRKDDGLMSYTIFADGHGVVRASSVLFRFYSESGILYVVSLDNRVIESGKYSINGNTLVFNDIDYEKMKESDSSHTTNDTETNTSSLTVNIDEFTATQYGLTLSDTRDFYTSAATLSPHIPKEMTNISETWLPADLDKIDGEHNGDNYVAYTFYLKNAGEGMVAYNYQMYMVNAVNDLDEAIRIRLYTDGEWTNYARTATDGSGAEPGTTEFLTDRIITQGQRQGFNPGDVTKYTVVIWIEGDDPDCIDDLLGGELKIAMDFEIVK